ncbi:MAG: methyltransferase domain-containing protein [Bdellovibrionales bacterium]|nr:methyltransferase domain-containing protein [Bdellovibrionales bacterium]
MHFQSPGNAPGKSAPHSSEELVFTVPVAYRVVAAGLQHVEADHLLGRYEFKGSDTIVDLGCGDGSFSIDRLLNGAGEGGTLFAIDRSPQMLETLRGLAGMALHKIPGVISVEADLGNPDRSWVEDIVQRAGARGGVDLIFSNATLHHLYSREQQITVLGHCLKLMEGAESHKAPMALFSFAGAGNYQELIGAAEKARSELQLERYFANWKGYPLLRPTAALYDAIVREAGFDQQGWQVEIEPTELVTLFNDEEELIQFCRLCLRSYMNQIRTAAVDLQESSTITEQTVSTFAARIAANYLGQLEDRPDGKIPLANRNLEVAIRRRSVSARVSQFTSGESVQLAHEDQLVKFLDTVSNLPEVLAYKPRVDHLLELRPGIRLLDAGAGVGNDALRIARLMGETGSVVAIDKNSYRVRILAQRALMQEIKTVLAEPGDILDLARFAGEFDRFFVERTLIHVSDPARAIKELLNTLKPGGSFVVVEPDFSSVNFASSDRECTSQIVHARASEIANPTIGRELSRLFAAGGAEILSEEAVPLRHDYQASQLLDLNDIAQAAERGDSRYPSPARLKVWLSEQSARARDGTFESLTMMHIVKGTKHS